MSELLGKTVHMYSRAGKSTMNQYLAFSDKPKVRPWSENKVRNWDEEDEEDIESQVIKILAKEDKDGGFFTANADGDGHAADSAQNYGTFSFKAVSREKHEKVFRNKTITPDHGKYKLNYNLLKQNWPRRVLFYHKTTLPRQKNNEQRKVDDLCNRLVRVAQNRDTRINLINTIYRKKKIKNYKFTEQRIKDLLTTYIQTEGTKSNLGMTQISDMQSFGTIDNFKSPTIDKRKTIVDQKRATTAHTDITNILSITSSPENKRMLKQMRKANNSTLMSTDTNWK